MAQSPKNNATPAPPPPDASLARRFRYGMQQFRRGRDRKWYFPGQQADEEVRLVVRKHWWFLVRPALPFIGALVVFFALLMGSTSGYLPGNLSTWLVIDAVAFLAVLVTGAWFAYKDLIDWWYQTYMITNKRIINARGLVQITRQETPIERVQQMVTRSESLLGWLLGFGTVYVYLTGGNFLIKDVPNPERVRDAIQGVAEEFKAKKPKPPEPPKPRDPIIAAEIERLATPKPVDKLPNPDEHLPPLPGKNRLLGPRRTFGGILRIPARVHYIGGEHTVKYVQRSRYVLWRNLSLPALLLLIIVPVAAYMSGTGVISEASLGYWWLAVGLVALVLLVWMGLIYTNYIDDVYIFTNRRILDIERLFGIFYEEHIECEYKAIRDIKVKVPSLIQRILDIGDVYIETPGSSPDIILRTVDRPFILQDEISGIRGHKDKEDKANKENAEKKLLHMWFGTVITKMEETETSRGVPDLKYKDLVTAIAYAQKFGLDVTIGDGGVPSTSLPPGTVVEQSPPPGTLMERGSKIQITLSTRSW